MENLKIEVIYAPIVSMPYHVQNPDSLASYMQHITEALFEFDQISTSTVVNRKLKTNRMNELIKSMLDVQTFFQNLDFTISETKLLAMNTLLSASECGMSGESFSELVAQVTLLCDQSHRFMSEVDFSLKASNKMLENLIGLIDKTIEGEQKTALSVIANVEFYIGKLQTHAENMNQFFGLDGVYERNEIKHYIDQWFKGDFDSLKISLNKCRDHSIKIMRNYKNSIEDDGRVMQLIETLELLLSAKLEIKKSSFFSENIHFSLC